MGLRAQLERMGHLVIGDAAGMADAEALFRQKQPDLVLMDIQLGADDGIEITRRLLKYRACPIIIVSAYSDSDLIERATAAGIFGYLIKPITPQALAAQIEVAVNRFRDQLQLAAEKDALAQNLLTRKLVEKAKGILMKRLNLDEPEAHKRLQQESQRRRQSIAELSKSIIDNEELFGGN
jgi:AmiR/NasT family two-component response regulator